MLMNKAAMTFRPFQLLVTAVALILTGCIPLTQSNVTGGKRFDHFGYFGDLGYGLLQIGPSNKRKMVTIIPAESYAIRPDGIRVGIATEPNPADLNKKAGDLVPYIRDRVYLLDPKGRRVARWPNGQWTFYFVLRTSRGKETRTFQLDLWTFHYNPILHGSPL